MRTMGTTSAGGGEDIGTETITPMMMMRKGAGKGGVDVKGRMTTTTSTGMTRSGTSITTTGSTGRETAAPDAEAPCDPRVS